MPSGNETILYQYGEEAVFTIMQELDMYPKLRDTSRRTPDRLQQDEREELEKLVQFMQMRGYPDVNESGIMKTLDFMKKSPCNPNGTVAQWQLFKRTKSHPSKRSLIKTHGRCAQKFLVEVVSKYPVFYKEDLCRITGPQLLRSGVQPAWANIFMMISTKCPRVDELAVFEAWRKLRRAKLSNSLSKHDPAIDFDLAPLKTEPFAEEEDASKAGSSGAANAPVSVPVSSEDPRTSAHPPQTDAAMPEVSVLATLINQPSPETYSRPALIGEEGPSHQPPPAPSSEPLPSTNAERELYHLPQPARHVSGANTESMIRGIYDEVKRQRSDASAVFRKPQLPVWNTFHGSTTQAQQDMAAKPKRRPRVQSSLQRPESAISGLGTVHLPVQPNVATAPQFQEQNSIFWNIPPPANQNTLGADQMEPMRPHTSFGFYSQDAQPNFSANVPSSGPPPVENTQVVQSPFAPAPCRHTSQPPRAEAAFQSPSYNPNCGSMEPNHGVAFSSSQCPNPQDSGLNKTDTSSTRKAVIEDVQGQRSEAPTVFLKPKLPVYRAQQNTLTGQMEPMRPHPSFGFYSHDAQPNFSANVASSHPPSVENTKTVQSPFTQAPYRHNSVQQPPRAGTSFQSPSYGPNSFSNFQSPVNQMRTNTVPEQPSCRPHTALGFRAHDGQPNLSAHVPSSHQSSVQYTNTVQSPYEPAPCRHSTGPRSTRKRRYREEKSCQRPAPPNFAANVPNSHHPTVLNTNTVQSPYAPAPFGHTSNFPPPVNQNTLGADQVDPMRPHTSFGFYSQYAQPNFSANVPISRPPPVQHTNTVPSPYAPASFRHTSQLPRAEAAFQSPSYNPNYGSMAPNHIMTFNSGRHEPAQQFQDPSTCAPQMQHQQQQNNFYHLNYPATASGWGASTPFIQSSGYPAHPTAYFTSPTLTPSFLPGAYTPQSAQWQAHQHQLSATWSQYNPGSWARDPFPATSPDTQNLGGTAHHGQSQVEDRPHTTMGFY